MSWHGGQFFDIILGRVEIVQMQTLTVPFPKW